MVLSMISPEILKEQQEFDWMGSTSAAPITTSEPHLLFTAPENEAPYERKLRMLREVKRACMACTMCDLGRKGASKDGKLFRDPHVFSNMNPTRFMVFGQGPGWHELEKCEPFVGAAGENFNIEIVKYGLSRNDFYISNAVRCYVKDNQPPNHEHINRCKPFLMIEVNLIRPLLIITLGAVAFRVFCPTANYNESLGKLIHSAEFDINVFAVYHPSPLNLSDIIRRAEFEHQMCLICKVINRIKSGQNNA